MDCLKTGDASALGHLLNGTGNVLAITMEDEKFVAELLGPAGELLGRSGWTSEPTLAMSQVVEQLGSPARRRLLGRQMPQARSR